MSTTTLPTIGRDLLLEERVLQFAARQRLWRPLVRFAEPRLRIPIYRDDELEVKLLTWLPGQSTGLHDHGGSTGCFMVLEGYICETLVEPTGCVLELQHAPGDIGSFNVDIVHDIRNESAFSAITLHAYRPAITKSTHYRLEDGILVAGETQVFG